MKIPLKRHFIVGAAILFFGVIAMANILFQGFRVSETSENDIVTLAQQQGDSTSVATAIRSVRQAITSFVISGFITVVAISMFMSLIVYFFACGSNHLAKTEDTQLDEPRRASSDRL